MCFAANGTERLRCHARRRRRCRPQDRSNSDGPMSEHPTGRVRADPSVSLTVSPTVSPTVPPSVSPTVPTTGPTTGPPTVPAGVPRTLPPTGPPNDALPMTPLPMTPIPPPAGTAPPVVARGPVPMPPHRRWSLRARLIALVVAVAAVALIAVDIVLPLVVRDTQIAAKEVTLAGVIATVSRDTSVTQKTLADLSQKAQLRGEIGWSTVSADGISVVQVPTASNAAANPQLTGNEWIGAPATVLDAADSNQRYLARGFPVGLGDEPGYLVAWMPLDDVDQTFRRLVLVELLVTVGLLILLGATAGLVIRRELRPLETC